MITPPAFGAINERSEKITKCECIFVAFHKKKKKLRWLSTKLGGRGAKNKGTKRKSYFPNPPSLWRHWTENVTHVQYHFTKTFKEASTKEHDKKHSSVIHSHISKQNVSHLLLLFYYLGLRRVCLLLFFCEPVLTRKRTKNETGH